MQKHTEHTFTFTPAEVSMLVEMQKNAEDRVWNVYQNNGVDSLEKWNPADKEAYNALKSFGQYIIGYEQTGTTEVPKARCR